MKLSPGARLGPYEILGPLGEGGMGEVHRARDTRLGREVAVKVLPALVTENPERLHRFEQEARSAGRLNHPNLLTVFDVGTHGGTAYLVTELLEGETLRAQLEAGPLPVRKAVDYGIQVCRGLAAAHEKGIAHRDLKPENLLVTRDGRVKILDFGLAKPVHTLHDGRDDAATTGSLETAPGLILGTVGYLSPEQIKGVPADLRSDIFAFGAVLYEMLSGRRAFKQESPVETMSAILREDPSPLAECAGVPPALALIVQHCLEKSPEQRFQSARDVVFNLESVWGAPTRVGPARLRRRDLGLAAGGLLLLALGALAGGWLERTPPPRPPSYKQLTFRRGYVGAARFAPDGHTILYSASWQGSPPEVFSTRVDSPESRSLGFAPADLLAVSASGETALSLRSQRKGPFQRLGTLARVPFGGGAPRELLEDVEWADWSPDGEELAIVRRRRLEYPVGQPLCETEGWISHPRVSPRGDLVAFLEHPAAGDDDGGLVAVVDRTGRKRVLCSGWLSARGLAWHGEEVWFTATREGNNRSLHAVSLAGRERLLARAPGTLILADVSRDGRALVTQGSERGGIMALAPGGSLERDVSWLDWSVLTDLSDDGRTVLFHEAGEGGTAYAAYLRGTDGSPAVRLAEGRSVALSPDRKWALCLSRGPRPRLVLMPTGPGQSRSLPVGDLERPMARWFPDGRRVLLIGAMPGRGQRLFVQDLEAAGAPRPLTPEGFDVSGNPVSPDARFVAASGPEGRLVLIPVAGGEPRPIPGTEPGDHPARWSRDGRSLFVFRNDTVPARVLRIDVATGRRTPWRDLVPPDPAGVLRIGAVIVAADGQAHAYNYARFLYDLYLVEGLR